MQSIDYNYIGTIIGSVFGIPTRIYKNNTLIFYYSTVNLIKDPVSIYIEEVSAEKKEIRMAIPEGLLDL